MASKSQDITELVLLPLPTFTLFILPLLVLFGLVKTKVKSRSLSSPSKLFPKSYPIIGSAPAISANQKRRVQWISDLLQISPNSTFVLNRCFGDRQVFTANPANVQHILKSHFSIYPKGEYFRKTLTDFLGNGIFNSDGENWKFQRQNASHAFNTRSLKSFVEKVVDEELYEKLIPILSEAAANKTVLDLQDILQRFAFDNICKVAFGYDPKYLLPSSPEQSFTSDFEEATTTISGRFNCNFHFIWQLKKAFNIGSEKRLRMVVSEVRDFAKQVIREKKKELDSKSYLDSVDLLSRFLNSGHSDEEMIVDVVISFILAGRDTTSAALSWFFWLLSKNPDAENKILKEITEEKQSKTECSVYEEVKDMVYTHASLCESMRLYPPVPVDTKVAAIDDVLPDGTVVKKGNRVTYHPYAMGRLEKLWGTDWAEFKPERWLQRDPVSGKWSFVGRDVYTYPVFQAGPRVCLGKEMAFLQMKRVVAGVLSRCRVVPAVECFEPVFVATLTSKMGGGFPVRFVERGVEK
ncbi:Cytochrome P450 [Dillenia turbinata]|uniref:Cytochrome P450 n=1 Tax=Dillenia turbinata TaxID=194707 RepID=A0AAN8VU44_9MAGN